MKASTEGKHSLVDEKSKKDDDHGHNVSRVARSAGTSKTDPNQANTMSNLVWSQLIKSQQVQYSNAEVIRPKRADFW